MNKKVMIVSGVILLLLIAGGGFFFLNSRTPASNSQDANTNTKQVQAAPTSGSVISSIKEALMGSGSFTCNYTDENGMKTASFIKNGMIRVDVSGDTPEKSGSVLMRDKTFYSWNMRSTTGIKMTLPEDVVNMADEDGKDQSNEQQKEMIENLEKYKESCKQGAISDSLFTVPEDVKFTDMSQALSPAAGRGVGTQPSIDPKQFEEMMKQYAPEDSTTPSGE